jgi:hypothetical protein
MALTVWLAAALPTALAGGPTAPAGDPNALSGDPATLSVGPDAPAGGPAEFWAALTLPDVLAVDLATATVVRQEG